jgi:hypothetical protein
MRVKIEIAVDCAAFDNNTAEEIAGILRGLDAPELLWQVMNADPTGTPLRDTNDSAVGWIWIEKTDAERRRLIVGKRIRLLHCSDLYTSLTPGALGRIAMVDVLGTIHVDWDNGSRLGLCPETDRFEIILEEG